MRYLPFLLFIFVLTSKGYANNSAQTGYRIETELKNFDGDTLLLGYYFGKAQYIKDTAIVNSKGKFVFEGEEELKPGVYLLVLPPDNRFIHLLIPGGNTEILFSVDVNDIVHTARFKGSTENELYYSYLQELDKRRPLADTLRKKITEDSLNKATYQAELDKLDQEVKKIQDDILDKHPGTLTAMLIRSNRETPIPEFAELAEEDRKQKQFEFYREHYFDNFDLNDPRAMRSGLIHNKIDFFLQKLNYQYPDSQSIAMDYLLGKMDKNEEAFQYYLVHFLNESARSKRMGMDAVYVHLIDNYYAKGHATWADKEQLEKLMAQAETIRPTLIGKIAPELTFYKENGQPVSIHSIPAAYTVLFFWDPECGHCKKSIPAVIEFYNEFKDRGVEILAICTKTGQDISSCWSTVQERGMGIWVNAADQYMRSRYKSVYDVKTTPQIFILDKDKKILVKKIAGEDLKTVMTELLKVDGEESR